MHHVTPLCRPSSRLIAGTTPFWGGSCDQGVERTFSTVTKPHPGDSNYGPHAGIPYQCLSILRWNSISKCPLVFLQWF